MKNIEKYYGKKIVRANITEGHLTLNFDDGTGVRVYDGGQSCCEHRYMSTDDDVAGLIGETLVRVDEKEGPEINNEYETHETCFVEVGTDKGFITIVNHNEHNGYYGGFYVCAEEVK